MATTKAAVAKAAPKSKAAPKAKAEAAPKKPTKSLFDAPAPASKKPPKLNQPTRNEDAKTVDAAPKVERQPKEKAGKGKAPKVTKLPAQKTVTKNPAGATGARAGAATVAEEEKSARGVKKSTSDSSSSSGKRGRRSQYDEASKITMLTKDNPKRQGTAAYEVFEKLKKSKTVAEFYKLGGNSTNLGWNESHKLIKIG